MLRKAKQNHHDVAGDWSTTGTFLRKPAGGWLHEDRELQNGLSVNYNVQVLNHPSSPAQGLHVIRTVTLVSSSIDTLQWLLKCAVVQDIHTLTLVLSILFTLLYYVMVITENTAY